MRKNECCFCSKEIKKDDEFNFVFGRASHKRCDKKYFKAQEKRINYGRRTIYY